MIKKIIGNLILLSMILVAQNANIHHSLNVKIVPEKSSIEVIDEMIIKPEILNEKFVFTLNSSLSVNIITPNLKLELTKKEFLADDIGMDRDDAEKQSSLLLNEYTISGFDQKKDLNIKMNYSGIIDSPIEQSEENYQRGFSESPGIISDIGIYLAGSTYWIPTIEDEMVTFTLETSLPPLWRTVSQGKRTEDKIEDQSHTDIWESNSPQEEVFLIAAKFNEYKYSVGSVDAFAFLRTPDEALANKYLETTAQYLEMYRKLVGPFPYTKFALVENFWETGYGMPSFTLLGEKIIRFPFILHSSYPHELLHNWWGNSVYVDFETGNWCEGLTAYMADHLIKEQRGQAEEYRRSTVQKFTDFVNETNDFPLSKFLSRTDGPSEAIGYGKALMMFHMLRLKVGDENFTRAFQSFNRTNKFKKASYKDIQTAFEEATKQDLSWFFNQWISRTGAPELLLNNVTVSESGEDFELKFELEQVQKGDSFIIDVPIIIIDEEGAHPKNLYLDQKSAKFSLKTKSRPLKLMIDPQFDIMRKLDSREIPPAFTKAYGAKKSLLVLPIKSDSYFPEYQEFVNGWIKGKEDNYEIVNESEISELPVDKTVWIIGEKNQHLSKISSSLNNYGFSIQADSILVNKKNYSTTNNSFFTAVNNPQNIEEVILFLSIGNKESVPGLLRKLPHYGKYSFLAFEGDEPTNIEKGQWPVLDSPLMKNLTEAAKDLNPTFEKREALATLAPAFSSTRMMEHISYLASEEMKGRELGSLEIDKAAEYIVNKFEEYGLLPGSDDGTFYQSFEKAFHGKGNLSVKNIIGIIPGVNPDLKEAVVISAHYDHLGLGWPDARKGNEGKIHFGADDNASGVSVLLELAKSLGDSFKPGRTVIFVAFSGEEAGLIGSKYFVDNYKKYPSNQILANLNFDTVGRLFQNKMMILNGNTAREWKFIFMGTEYTTGIPSEIITQDLDASDQVSFIEKGIPAIQFFSGPNEDYHKPSDTFDKIDSDGLVKFATVGKEVLQYLADRTEQMNFTGTVNTKKQSGKSNNANQGRKVSTGTMPDFAYSGEGVKVGAVSEDSPGAKAGLLKGDIIKKLGGKEIKNLKDYSNLLKEHSPGDVINLEIDRNGELLNISLELTER